ncbi:MAG TPA: type II secretion system F family protein [Planctomycetaceae bacterium]|nr:type II secretion system F family protein [Planctomycetaceae bacterium]
MLLFAAQLAFLAAAVTVPFVVVMVLAARRRARQASLLWLLAISVEKELPLEDELEAYSDGLTGRHRSDVVYLAEVLRSGDSLPDALAFIPGLVPQDAVMAAHVGAESGRLAEALRDAALRHQRGESAGVSPAMSLFAAGLYFGVVLNYAAFLTFFLMYYIVPKFKKIFEDFDTELPQVTQHLITASNVLAEWIAAPFAAWLGILGLLVLMGWATVRGWGEFRFNWLGRWLTGVDRPHVLRNLALVAAGGLPIEKGLQAIAREHRRINIRRRASTALLHCREGSDPWQALGLAGLLRPAEEELLRSAQTNGNVPWALRELADTIEQRRWFRLAAALEVLQPVAVVALGLVVLVICVSFFLPLVKIVNDLS